MRINCAGEVVAQYSRLGMCCLVSLESVAQVMLVVHVTLGAQVVVEAHLALPSHSHDAMLLAAVTDDVGVADSWSGRRVCLVINLTCLRFLFYFYFKEINFSKERVMSCTASIVLLCISHLQITEADMLYVMSLPMLLITMGNIMRCGGAEAQRA